MCLDNGGHYIEPIHFDTSRLFSRNHLIFLFTSIDNLLHTADNLEKSLNQVGFKDYVILEIHCKDQSIQYPYALYVVIKQYTDAYLESVCDGDIYEEAMEYKESYEDNKEEYLTAIEDLIFTLVTHAVRSDSLEISYPEKIADFIDDWNIKRITRNGVYKEDPRLTDDVIIFEIIGFNGPNNYYYLAQANSNNKSKLDEIEQEISNTLTFNETWQQHIIRIIKELGNEKEPFRIGISIYNQQDILLTTTVCAYYGDPDYIPNYQIFVDYIDKPLTKKFYGIISWNSKRTDLSEIACKYWHNDLFNYLMEKHSYAGLPCDEQIMNDLGLEYLTEAEILDEGKEMNYHIVFGITNIKYDLPYSGLNIIDFIMNETKLVKDIINFYKKCTDYLK